MRAVNISIARVHMKPQQKQAAVRLRVSARLLSWLTQRLPYFINWSVLRGVGVVGEHGLVKIGFISTYYNPLLWIIGF